MAQVLAKLKVKMTAVVFGPNASMLESIPCVLSL